MHFGPGAHGLIYRITNSVNGKFYIGQTTMALTHRWECHTSEARRGKLPSPIYRAMRKYGAAAFSIRVVGVADTQADLNQLEAEIVRESGAMKPGAGYNAREGGGAGGKMTAEAKKRMSESRRGEKHWSFGREFSEDHRRRLGDAFRARGGMPPEAHAKRSATMMGHAVSPETRAKISAGRKGWKHPPEVVAQIAEKNRGRISKRRLHVRDIATGRIFHGLGEAAVFAGLSSAAICKHIKTGRPLKSGHQLEKIQV